MGVIDPTDDEGKILELYRDNPTLYINEPPPGKSINCRFVEDDSIEHYWVYTCVSIKSGDQLYIFYGKEYEREYTINQNDKVYRNGSFKLPLLKIDKKGKLDVFYYLNGIKRSITINI